MVVEGVKCGGVGWGGKLNGIGDVCEGVKKRVLIRAPINDFQQSPPS